MSWTPAALDHLSDAPVDDPDCVTAGIRELMGKVPNFCTMAPRFCNRAYDVNNKRATTGTRE